MSVINVFYISYENVLYMALLRHKNAVLFIDAKDPINILSSINCSSRVEGV